MPLFGQLFSKRADVCRRVAQVRHSERLSGIPKVLMLVSAIGRQADFRVALPHVAGSSLVEATKAADASGAPRTRPTVPLSHYVTVHPEAEGMHSQCDALGRPAIELIFASRDDASVSLEKPVRWCGDQGTSSMQICMFDWTPCDANAHKKAAANPAYRCPSYGTPVARRTKKTSTPFEVVVKLMKAAFELMETRYPPSSSPTGTSYAASSKKGWKRRAADPTSVPTIVMPSGQNWYKDIGGVPTNKSAPFTFKSLAPELKAVVERIERQRTGCKATGGVSAAAMLRLSRNGANSKLVRTFAFLHRRKVDLASTARAVGNEAVAPPAYLSLTARLVCVRACVCLRLC